MSLTQHEIISLKISELDESLKLSTPNMPTLLREIHQTLKQDPENVTLLTPEEVAIIISGLSKQTSTQITTSILSGAKGKSLKKLSLDDI
jgi:ribosomal protein L6P/L9E